VLGVTIEAARVIKHKNQKEDVRIVDMETKRWCTIADLVNEPVWQEPLWEPTAKPLTNSSQEKATR
jgi:hypothetical protein